MILQNVSLPNQQLQGKAAGVGVQPVCVLASVLCEMSNYRRLPSLQVIVLGE